MTARSVLRFTCSNFRRQSLLGISTSHAVFSRHLASSLLNNCPRKNIESSYTHQISTQRHLGNNPKKNVEKTPKQLKIEQEIFEESSNLGLFARFKLMYKNYWYVLIPVHCVTSIAWLGGFYYMSTRLV